MEDSGCKKYSFGIYFNSRKEIDDLLKITKKYSSEAFVTKEIIKDIRDEVSLYNQINS